MESFKPSGVCARNIEFEIENDVVKKVKFTGGCNGNLQGIATLVEGMNVHDVIKKLEGLHCGPRPTSCPDQLSIALKNAIQ